MNIGIIGTGNVGGALASNWASKGHNIYLGVRDLQNFKGIELTNEKGITAVSISEVTSKADVILIAASTEHTVSIINSIGKTDGVIIIDAMNSVMTKPEGYKNSFDAIKDNAKGALVVKCFNSTGFENMKDPIYNGDGIDMFVAGDSERAKGVAIQLSKDAGFGNCYDFGGDDKADLLEKFALSWINLAIMQGVGRNIAFKVLKR